MAGNAENADRLYGDISENITYYYQGQQNLLEALKDACNSPLNEYKEILAMTAPTYKDYGAMASIALDLLTTAFPAVRALTKAKEVLGYVEKGRAAVAAASDLAAGFQTERDGRDAQLQALERCDQVMDYLEGAKNAVRKLGKSRLDQLKQVRNEPRAAAFLPAIKVQWNFATLAIDTIDPVKQAEAFRMMLLYQMVRHYIRTTVVMNMDMRTPYEDAPRDSRGRPTWLKNDNIREMTVIVDYTGLNATQRKHVLDRFEKRDLKFMGKIPGNAKLLKMQPLKDEYDFHLVMGAKLAFVPARPLRPPVTAGSEVNSQGHAKHF